MSKKYVPKKCKVEDCIIHHKQFYELLCAGKPNQSVFVRTYTTEHVTLFSASALIRVNRHNYGKDGLCFGAYRWEPTGELIAVTDYQLPGMDKVNMFEYYGKEDLWFDYGDTEKRYDTFRVLETALEKEGFRAEPYWFQNIPPDGYLVDFNTKHLRLIGNDSIIMLPIKKIGEKI